MCIQVIIVLVVTNQWDIKRGVKEKEKGPKEGNERVARCMKAAAVRCFVFVYEKNKHAHPKSIMVIGQSPNYLTKYYLTGQL